MLTRRHDKTEDQVMAQKAHKIKKKKVVRQSKKLYL